MTRSLLHLVQRHPFFRSLALLVAAAVLATSCSANSSEAANSEPRSEIAAEPTTAPDLPTPTSEPETADDQSQPAVDTLPLPGNAADLAAALTEAEFAIVNPDTPVEELPAWGRRQQALYQLLDIERSWFDEVKAAIPADVTPAFDLNWAAKDALTSLVTREKARSVLPAWRLIEPDPADELLAHYKAAEEESGIEWEYVAAINLVETRMGRIEGVSTAGAVGPMQFLPSTWNECCEGDPTNTGDAISGAAKYLTDRGGPSDMDKAILGYNNSEFYVEAVKAYAQVLRTNETSYYAFHGWEIYFRSSEGLILMPSDYEQTEEVAVEDWLVENPNTLFPDGYNKQ